MEVYTSNKSAEDKIREVMDKYHDDIARFRDNPPSLFDRAKIVFTNEEALYLFQIVCAYIAMSVDDHAENTEEFKLLLAILVRILTARTKERNKGVK